MKKNIFRSLYPVIAAAFVIMLSATSCVKDEAFDNHEYGITDPANQPKGVLFQQSRFNANGDQSPAVNGIVGVSTEQIIQTVVKVAANGPVTSDLTVKITPNNDLVGPSGLVILDPQYYEIVTTDVVIPAGEKYTSLEIKIPNASAIDPSQVYGLGFTITEVGSGYTIAANSKDVVVGIAIKNEWDGVYSVEGYVYHPSSPRAIVVPGQEKELKTISANSVSCEFGDLGSLNYYALLTIDPITNHVSISDYSAGTPIEGLDDGLPSTNPGYTAQWAGSPECNNTYDPATKTFYLRMAYMGSTGWRVSEEILVRQ